MTDVSIEMVVHMYETIWLLTASRGGEFRETTIPNSHIQNNSHRLNVFLLQISKQSKRSPPKSVSRRKNAVKNQIIEIEIFLLFASRTWNLHCSANENRCAIYLSTRHSEPLVHM